MSEDGKVMSKIPAEYGPGMDETGRVNYDFPPRGVAYGKPSPGLRNHDCRVDGHRDPDNSGLCIHCSVSLGGEDEDDE